MRGYIMAAHQSQVQKLQEAHVQPEDILFKIDGKTIEEYLKIFTFKDNALAPFIGCAESFCAALIEQPMFILDALPSNPAFYEWFSKALVVASRIFLDPEIFNPEFQKYIKPLMDFLYYFNQADSTIKPILCRFEVIVLITLEMKPRFDENYGKNFGFGQRIADGIFTEGSTETPKNVLSVLFEDYTGLKAAKGEEPISLLKQAYCAACLINRIKIHPHFKTLEKAREQNLLAYLEGLKNNYFSQKNIVNTYSKSHSENTSIRKLFAKVELLVDSRISILNRRDISFSLDEKTHKASGYIELFKQYASHTITFTNLFLTLFENKSNLAFHSKDTADLQALCASVKEKEKMIISWHPVLARLICLPGASRSDTTLGKKVHFFADALALATALKVPNLNELELILDDMEAMAYASSRSPKK